MVCGRVCDMLDVGMEWNKLHGVLGVADCHGVREPYFWVCFMVRFFFSILLRLMDGINEFLYLFLVSRWSLQNGSGIM